MIKKIVSAVCPTFENCLLCCFRDEKKKTKKKTAGDLKNKTKDSASVVSNSNANMFVFN